MVSLNIKFFGNSITRSKLIDLQPESFDSNKHNQPFTFVDRIYQYYNCVDTNNTCRGRARCSEERILFYLKKTKKIDVAIIFHSSFENEFCVSAVEDYAHSDIDDENMQYLLENNIQNSFYTNVQKQLPKSINDANIHLYPQEIKALLADHRRLYYHIDLQRNRFHGALIQIDQYLTSKNIKAIHCMYHPLPDWFKFSSGIVDYDFAKFQYTEPYTCSYAKSTNAISEEGNIIIANKLISYIDELYSN